jgi:hypothetical protein
MSYLTSHISRLTPHTAPSGPEGSNITTLLRGFCAYVQSPIEMSLSALQTNGPVRAPSGPRICLAGATLLGTDLGRIQHAATRRFLIFDQLPFYAKEGYNAHKPATWDEDSRLVPTPPTAQRGKNIGRSR